MRSAKVLHESGQHLDAVFNLQQSIEFMLKALIAHRSQIVPPKTHDLLELLSASKETFPAEQMKILDELHDISVPLRYPDDLDEALESYTYDEVSRINREVEELLSWLKQKLN
jgi:HEPN domain-containing protein